MLPGEGIVGHHHLLDQAVLRLSGDIAAGWVTIDVGDATSGEQHAHLCLSGVSRFEFPDLRAGESGLVIGRAAVIDDSFWLFFRSECVWRFWCTHYAVFRGNHTASLIPLRSHG